MRMRRAFLVCSAFILLLGVLSFAPAAVPPAYAGSPTTLSYNLYATDGYVELADGTFVYNYGFVGGREGVDLIYQTSPCMFDPAAGVRVCGVSSNVLVPGGPPAPTGGQIQDVEAQFAGNAQFPAPVIYAAKGDVVELRLKNLGVKANPAAPNDPHSIHLHGVDVDAANDGVPETSVGAVPANLCVNGSTAAPGTQCDPMPPVGGPAPGAGNVIVYMFSPKHLGTSMWHCHQEADIHVNMGMYGALVTYNRSDPAYSNGGPGKGFGGMFNGFPYDKDYIMLVSEMDIRGHADEEGTYGSVVPVNTWDPVPYNWALYQPQYWFINGLSFPQTIHAGFPSGYGYAQWIEAHPGYETLYTGSVNRFNVKWASSGEKVLLRVINMGFETQPLHMHGFHGKVIGSDQRVWDWGNQPWGARKLPTPFGKGLEKNTLTIGSGETYEWLVDFGQQNFQSTYPDQMTSRYPGGTQSCYDPATNAPIPNVPGCPPIPVGGEPSATDFYIPGPTVTGLEGPTYPFDLAGYAASQYFPFHNHDDYKATNNGSYPGGMFTMLVPTP